MIDIVRIVEEYRRKDLHGNIVDLSPVKNEDLSHIVRMRNTPKMMYFFNQKKELTIEEQKEWFEKYLQRKDDLYWSIKDKEGHIIGANRLYNIKQGCCEQGSLMIDEAYSMAAPFAVEAIMLSLDFAFNVLQAKTVINENRYDNKNMNSLTKRFGFRFLYEIDIRGVTYNYYELQKDSYKRDTIKEVINLWLDR